MKSNMQIQYWAHMLDEAYDNQLTEKDKTSDKPKDGKMTLDKLCKMIKVMRPGAVMQFVAKFSGEDPAKFIAKNSLRLAAKAVKNGWTKSADIAKSIKDIGKKNKDDKSGIDYSKLKLDPSTMTFKCLFDGDTGKKLDAFMEEFESEVKDEGKEIEKADKQLHDDVKKAGVDMDEQEVDDNGLAVASVIDNKKNKGKSGKELKKKIEGAIKKDKQAKEIQKISKELKKASSKVKVDKKYEKMSDEELAKLDDKINKKIHNGSEASKKNDAFRNKIKNAVQKGVAEDFKKSVKTAYVSTDALKKTIAKNMKPGLAVEQIKEPRAVCISVQCGKKDFKNILKEAKDDASSKIIDVTNGSKDKSIQKVIDYIKKVLQDKIGKDKLGKKIYAYLKNAGGNCLLYVFAGVKQDKLDESLMNEAEENWVADHFKDIVAGNNSVSGGSVVDSQTLKNVIYTMASKEKDPAKVTDMVRDWMNTNKKLLSSPSAFKDFMAGEPEDLDGNSLAEFIKQSCKNLDTLKSSVSQAVLDGSDTLNVDYALASSWSEGQKFADFDDVIKRINVLNPSDKDAVKELKSCIAAYKNYCAQFPSDNVIDGGKFNNNALIAFAAAFKAKTGESIDGVNVPDNVMKAAENYKGSISSFAKSIEKAAEQQGIEDIAEKSTQAASSATAAKDAAKAADAAQDIADKVTSTDVTAPQFSYMTMSKQLSDMDDFFDDGIVNSEEMQKLSDMGSKINEYTNWAIKHQGSTDPNIQAKIAEIHKLSNKYYDMLADNQTAINNAAANADDARTGATEATRAASKEMADNEEVKQAAGGWKEKLGLGKAFTALGWARLAAKSTAIILNNGKTVVDALGAAAMKFKEDNGVVAQMNFLLSNADDASTKFSDTKFSVRFNANDMKWHATCLDDRKMKFPEDEVIKKALSSEEGKKFKQACLKKWTPIFNPKDKTRNILAYIMSNFEKIGIKDGSKDAQKMSSTITKMTDNFNEVEKEFK